MHAGPMVHKDCLASRITKYISQNHTFNLNMGTTNQGAKNSNLRCTTKMLDLWIDNVTFFLFYFVCVFCLNAEKSISIKMLVEI